MNLLQQFLEENLNETTHSKILQHAQSCNNAVETLLYHLETLRTQHIDTITSQKLNKIQIYIETKQSLFRFSNSSLTDHNALFDWFLQYISSHPVLYTFLTKHHFKIKNQLLNIFRHIFPEYTQTQQIAEQLQEDKLFLVQWRQLCKQQNFGGNKKEILREIDNKNQLYEEEIVELHERMKLWNIQILKFTQKMLDIEQKLQNQFLACIQEKSHQVYSPKKKVNLMQTVSRINNFVDPINENIDSRLSINSKPLPTNPHQLVSQFQKTHLTPRKSLAQSIQRQKHQNQPLIFNPTQKSFKNYVQPHLPPNTDFQIFPMSRTLSNFNYHRGQVPKRDDNFTYTTSAFGNNVRVASRSKWNCTNNTRSSISYYPVR